VFRYIADASSLVGVAELTRHVGLNHNAVRQHLAVLKDAGIVLEDSEQRDRPGRPRLLYCLHPEMAGRWGIPGGYAWLAGVLSGAIRHQQDPRQEGRQEGRRRAGEFPSTADPADTLEQELTRRGFRPVRVEHGTRVEFVLGHCPFAEVAADDPDTICQLHLGLAEGLAEGLGNLVVERLEARDARQAGCRLSTRVSSANARISG
jgi:predicted ArsR family transcriptional regulator